MGTRLGKKGDFGDFEFGGWWSVSKTADLLGFSNRNNYRESSENT